MKKDSFIFDSYALLKLFQKEAGYEKVVNILVDIRNARKNKYINAMNLGEIIYITKKEFGDQKKIEVLGNIKRLDFYILPVPNSLIMQAAEYKAQYSISYADSFTLASAIEHNSVIVTGDPEFKKVEHLVTIEWIY